MVGSAILSRRIISFVENGRQSIISNYSRYFEQRFLVSSYFLTNLLSSLHSRSIMTIIITSLCLKVWPSFHHFCSHFKLYLPVRLWFLKVWPSFHHFCSRFELYLPVRLWFLSDTFSESECANQTLNRRKMIVWQLPNSWQSCQIYGFEAINMDNKILTRLRKSQDYLRSIRTIRVCKASFRASVEYWSFTIR